MLTIRLTRKGKKNQPFFRVVVIDKKRSSKGGRAVEELGFIDPLKKRISLKKERILYWISVGAKPSDTMQNWLIEQKIVKGEKINKFKKTAKAKAAEAKKIADEAAAKLAAEAAEKVAKEAPDVAPEKAETSSEPTLPENPIT